jgi:hypothetical protein
MGGFLRSRSGKALDLPVEFVTFIDNKQQLRNPVDISPAPLLGGTFEEMRLIEAG